MAAIHKISEDFYEDSFTLIALHTSMEDYAVVYAINSVVKTRFKRVSKDLVLSEHRSFPFFEWEDGQHDRYWTLITNKSTKKERWVGQDLFQDEPSFLDNYLVPENRDVDYLIKIEHDDDLDEPILVKNLLQIPKIITAYSIDADKLKSRNNLIF